MISLKKVLKKFKFYFKKYSKSKNSLKKVKVTQKSKFT